MAEAAIISIKGGLDHRRDFDARRPANRLRRSAETSDVARVGPLSWMGIFAGQSHGKPRIRLASAYGQQFPEGSTRKRSGIDLGSILAVRSLRICARLDRAPVNFGRAVRWAVVALTAGSSPMFAAEADLAVYAIHIEQRPKQSWSGVGVYLGGGYILTAAHVVGRADDTKPQVEVGGRLFSARAIKEGRFEETDLTLLKVDIELLPGKLQLRRMSLCTANPTTHQRVIVATPEGVAPSQVIAPRLLPDNIRNQLSTAIVDVATTGNSGSGVFDAERECLLGIISRKIQRVVRSGLQSRKIDIAKYFVPVDDIKRFLPKDIRF